MSLSLTGYIYLIRKDVKNEMFSEDLANNELKYIASLGSVAHTYGNLLATTQRWFLSLFQPNFFKTIHVSSMIAHKQILSTPHQFLKKSKPMIIFRPRIAFDEDTFLAKTLMVERMGGGPINSQCPGTIELHPFLFDEEKGMDLQFSEVRRVMNLDISIILNTYIQQLNYMELLKSEFVKDRPFDINTYLEAFLSKELMDTVSEISGVPIHDATGCIKDFMDYMNTHSYYPVTYKLAGATGKEEFYRYYPTKVLGTLTDLSEDQGESTGHVMTSYQINLSFRFEFWTPNVTYLFSNKIKEVPKPSVPTDATLIPVYADIFAEEDLHLAPGWQMYNHVSCQLDKPNDIMDFSPMLKESIRSVLDYHIKNGIPVLNFIDVKVRRQGYLIELGKDYDIDYKNLKIFFHNKDYGYYTYTIVIAIDVLYINNMVKELYNLE